MNDHRARQEALQAAQKQFLNALSAGQAGALDRFARPLLVGQKVLYHPPFDLIFKVDAIAPVLDPKAQPGLMAVTLSVTFPLHMIANRPEVGMVIVGQVDLDDPPAPDPPEEPAKIQLVDR